MARKRQSGAGQRRIQQKNAALAAGFTPQQAQKMRDYSEARFQETLRSRKLQNVPPTQRGFLDPKREIRREKARGREVNADIWSTWAKSDFPDWVERQARRLNRQAGLPRDDSYGWRAMYHHYVIENLRSDDDIEDDSVEFAESYETLASA